MHGSLGEKFLESSESSHPMNRATVMYFQIPISSFSTFCPATGFNLIDRSITLYEMNIDKVQAADVIIMDEKMK